MAAAVCELLEDLGNTFDSLLKKPDSFLRPRHKLSTQLKYTTKRLYDKLSGIESGDVKQRFSALPELIVDGFDDEQIWQELEMQNEACRRDFVNSISKIYVASNVGSEKAGPPSLSLGKKAADENPKECDDASGGSADDGIGSDASMDDDSDEGDVTDEDIGDLHTSLFGGRDDDGSMSDDSIELERALDKKIEMDRLQGEWNDSDDEELGGSDRKKLKSDEDASEDDDAVQVEHPNLLERSDKKKRKGGLTGLDHMKSPGRKSVVDDGFFKLSEMENFLLLEDEKERRASEGLKEEDGRGSDEESIDYFEDVPSDHSDQSDGEAQASRFSARKKILKTKYEDFFGNSNDVEAADGMSVGGDDGEISGDDRDDVGKPGAAQTNEVKSNFELHQELLKNKIEELEESNLADKPWQLKGETRAADRPENSILQEHLQFDHLSRPAPAITEEFTLSIEQIIKQRIKDQTWDNVERKVKPTEDHFAFKKRMILDQEKSKQSLAEIYEQQFIKQHQSEKVEEEKEDAAHKIIKKHMDSLFAKLNALSNFHYIPKPPVPDVKIVSNMPAVTVEDVAPVGISDAALLAPEEIKEKSRREVMAKEERSDTDKLRERRTKKSKQKHIRKAKEARKKVVERFKPGLGNKYSKIEAMKDLKNSGKVSIEDSKSKHKNESLKSSKTFFSKLQDEVQTSIQEKKAAKRGKDDAARISVAKLKL